MWSWLDTMLSKIQITNLEQLQPDITRILNNVPVEIVVKACRVRVREPYIEHTPMSHGDTKYNE